MRVSDEASKPVTLSDMSAGYKPITVIRRDLTCINFALDFESVVLIVMVQ